MDRTTWLRAEIRRLEQYAALLFQRENMVRVYSGTQRYSFRNQRYQVESKLQVLRGELAQRSIRPHSIDPTPPPAYIVQQLQRAPTPVYAPGIAPGFAPGSGASAAPPAAVAPSEAGVQSMALQTVQEATMAPGAPGAAFYTRPWFLVAAAGAGLLLWRNSQRKPVSA